MIPAELEEGRRLLGRYELAESCTTEFRDASIDLAAFFHEHADALLAEPPSLAALLAKFRAKQFACEQAGLRHEAAWWGEAQRLLGEAGDAEAALEHVRKEAVREFAESVAASMQLSSDHLKSREDEGLCLHGPISSEGWMFARAHMILSARDRGVELEKKS